VKLQYAVSLILEGSCLTFHSSVLDRLQSVVYVGFREAGERLDRDKTVICTFSNEVGVGGPFWAPTPTPGVP
jgi:hypothetical protein